MIEYEIRKVSGKPGEFSYDLKALALDFYPGKNCEVREREDWAATEGYPLICRIDGEECLHTVLAPGYSKNTVKAVLYRMFSKRTGIRLPWGILTGIRPAKIPLRLLWEGKGRQEIEGILREEYLADEKKIRLAVDVAEKENALTERFCHENSYNIYIGIPFCPSICKYCTFSSYPYNKYKKLVAGYLSALEKELVFVGGALAGRELHTVYVGGGTPTSLDEEQLSELLSLIRKYLPVGNSLAGGGPKASFQDGGFCAGGGPAGRVQDYVPPRAAEFTVEAGRPDSITGEKLRIMKEAGVTRISINPQTMKQHTLEILGRRHTVEQTGEAFRLARQCGFDNINMDVIVGLPEETEADFRGTMESVLALSPDSVTVHTLVIKRASGMRRDQMESGGAIHPEDKLIPVLQEESGRILRGRGYEPYYMYRQKNKAGTTRNTNQENVAYARPGKECLYNIFIMEELETIVALGCGGSTKQVFRGGSRMERIENIKGVEEYIHRIDEMIERKRKAFAESGW